MMRVSIGTMVKVGLFGVVASGCASSPAAPFNTMEKANVLVFRLQNFEQTAAVASVAPTAAAAGQSLIAGLPTEVQTWIQQGAAGLQQLLPGVVLPQGLQSGQQAAAAPVDTTQRFCGVRILSQNQVMDSELRASLGKLFGKADNFEAPKSNCMYPDYGISFGPTPGAPTYDMLISTSCHQVQSKSFNWPHTSGNGMKVGMEEDWAELVRKLLPS